MPSDKPNDKPDAEPDAELCKCGHPRSDHWRDSLICMSFTETEVFSCYCREWASPHVR